jgi:hypothetical protein
MAAKNASRWMLERCQTWVVAGYSGVPDAVVALAIAVERAEQKPEPVSLLGWL